MVVVNPYSNPPSGYTFSYDLNQLGPTITCIGYTNFTGNPIQQNTVWTLNGVGIVSSSTFALSNETSSVGGFGQTNLTILNVTNNLDGSTIACGIGSMQSQQIAIFTVKIYSKCNQQTFVTMHTYILRLHFRGSCTEDGGSGQWVERKLSYLPDWRYILTSSIPSSNIHHYWEWYTKCSSATVQPS